MSVLVAGIGNIFLGDDGFGVEVVRRLASEELPPGVKVKDFGIRGFDLAYALMEDHELSILVDATPQGGTPGTLYTIEVDPGQIDRAADATIDTHAMNPVRVLQLVKAMGGEPRSILVVGCEPAILEDENGMIGLSDPVEAAVDDAVSMVRSLIAGHEQRQRSIPIDATV
ncbi:MAG TPA: hydrogenase maturation protease [Thermoanaerobaculia bacterium]|nr:hydrogenase maturation protease [Thermoanaerobaculia bacterium]